MSDPTETASEPQCGVHEPIGYGIGPRCTEPRGHEGDHIATWWDGQRGCYVKVARWNGRVKGPLPG